MEKERSLLAERKNSHKKRQNLIAFSIITIGTIFSFLFFGNAQKEEDIQVSEPVKQVRVAKIGEDFESIVYLEKTSKIFSEESARVISEYTGRIANVNFEVGDYVEEGKILAEFEQGEQDNSARNSFELSEKNYDLAKKSLEEVRNLTEKNIDLTDSAVEVAEIQLNEARKGNDKTAIDLAEKSLEIAETQKDQAEISAKNQINSAKIQLQQADFQLKQARINLEKTFIKSPISGYIIAKNISKNEYLQTGVVVAQIVNEGKLQAVVYLSQKEVAKISQNDPVYFFIDGEKIEGKILGVAKIANEENQRFEIVMEVASKDKKLINQNTKIKIPLRLENQNQFFIPLEAVNVSQDKNEVFLFEDNKAKIVEIETGEIIGGMIEVRNGIKFGDQLIVQGNKNIRNGEEVQLVEN